MGGDAAVCLEKQHAPVFRDRRGGAGVPHVREGLQRRPVEKSAVLHDHLQPGGGLVQLRQQPGGFGKVGDHRRAVLFHAEEGAAAVGVGNYAAVFHTQTRGVAVPQYIEEIRVHCGQYVFAVGFGGGRHIGDGGLHFFVRVPVPGRAHVKGRALQVRLQQREDHGQPLAVLTGEFRKGKPLGHVFAFPRKDLQAVVVFRQQGFGVGKGFRPQKKALLPRPPPVFEGAPAERSLAVGEVFLGDIEHVGVQVVGLGVVEGVGVVPAAQRQLRLPRPGGRTHNGLHNAVRFHKGEVRQLHTAPPGIGWGYYTIAERGNAIKHFFVHSTQKSRPVFSCGGKHLNLIKTEKSL